MKRKTLSFLLLMIFIYMSSCIDVNAASDIFLGDSRTVLMYFATHPNDTNVRLEVDRLDKDGVYWKCKGGEGLKYMRDEAFPCVANYIEEDTNIYILFGVNDCHDINNINEYEEVFKKYFEKWDKKGANIYYVSVCPIKKDGENYSNNDVVAWNKKVLEDMSFRYMSYIDLYHGIKDWKYTDDIHYSHSCSVDMYDYITNYMDIVLEEQIKAEKEHIKKERKKNAERLEKL